MPDPPKKLPATDFDSREQALLAAYAMHSADSAGRVYDEPEHLYRSPFQRDRDRILHSSAFRRLSGKMQVFTGSMGDYHRTRLTHTMEVASVARTVSRALRLNEDLVEALALLHDIGHPPFGHAGEDALNESMKDHGGFSHNRFALTIVQEIERPYHRFPGLNLTRELLDGQQERIDKEDTTAQPLLEVQLVDAADSITYNAHDVDDAVKLDLLKLEDLFEIPLVDESLQRVRSRWPEIQGELQGRVRDEALRQGLVHELIDVQVNDIIQFGSKTLTAANCRNATDAKNQGLRLQLSPKMTSKRNELAAFLYQNVYRHPKLIEVRSRAQQQLQEMLAAYVKNPQLMPLPYQERAENTDVLTSAADYIAGMTDRFCLQQYQAVVIQ